MTIINKKLSSSIHVRPATARDKKHITYIVDNVVNAAYKSSESWTNTNDLVWTDRITVEAAEKMIDQQGQPNIVLYAVERQNFEDGKDIGNDGKTEEQNIPLKETVVGTLVIVLKEQKMGEALLSMLAVDPSQQSRGVGRLLMTEALKYIKIHLQPQVKEAIVHVFQSRNEIVSWYQRLGFENYGEVIPFHDKSIMVKDDPIVILRYRYY